MITADIFLKPGKQKSLLRRHPWVYDTAVARVRGKPAAGDTVAVRADDGQWLAWAAYSPASSIRARCWSFIESETIDAAWLSAKVHAAIARRAALQADSNALRLVFGEADALPGLVVDRYADQLVVQFQAAGVEAQRDVLLDALAQASNCPNIFERSDSATRKREGLEAASGVVRGAEPPARIRVREQGADYSVDYWVDVRNGHKTGFYVDQRDSRRLAFDIAVRLRTTVDTPRALNCFCYTGGFSMAVAKGFNAQAPQQVVSIDSSADALELARANWALNELPEHAADWRAADVFDALRAMRDAGERFDLIVLDPPKFASSHHHVDRAARAYKDINLNALRLLNPGGYLFTYSCSGAIDVDLFQKIVAGAVIDARVDSTNDTRVECQMVARLAAGEDHPLLMTAPETEYLKGLLLRRI